MRLARVVVPAAAAAGLAVAASPAAAAVSARDLALTAGSAFSGTVASAISRCDPGAVHPVVAWGDGATSAGQAVMTAQSTYDIDAAHTYAAAADYKLEVTIADCSSGGIESAGASVHVAAPPVVSPVPLPPPPPPPPADGIVATGAAAGHAPLVRVHDAITGQLRRSFLAYPAAFRGGVSVALGDVDGDGRADLITAPGPGGRARVKVFADGRRPRAWFAFGRGFRAGALVAAGDVDGDGRAEVIVGAGSGAAPRVRVFDGRTGRVRASFSAFGPAFRGGVRVAAGDVDGDGHADVIAGSGPGAAPHIKVLSGASGATLMSCFPFAPSFHGGVSVAAGDVDGDGHADVVAGTGPGVSPQAKVLSGAGGATLMSLLPYGPGAGGGVRVAAADADGDGRADVLTAGAGPVLRVFAGPAGSVLAAFAAGHGLSLAAAR